MTALLLQEVRANYGPYKALNGLTLTVRAGEAVAVLGRNGVGKSTLARVASALVPVSAGHLEVLGVASGKFTVHGLARRGVVHLPEGVGLFSGLTVEENLVLRVGGKTKTQRNDRLERAIENLGTLKDRRRVKAGLLSGGQQRLVAVSAALAAQPQLLLADEPALGLSPTAADDVYEALSTKLPNDAAMIIIETRLGRVEALCPRAVVLDSGRSIYDGATEGARQIMTSLLGGDGEVA